jgi:hypothetical protein
LENRGDGDQRRNRIREFLAANAALFARQGTVVETWRVSKGRRLGPYYQLRYRIDGRQCRKYLGSDVGFAAEVREELQRLQSGMRESRELRRLRISVRRELDRQHAIMDGELRPLGLRRQGNEIRGWRSQSRTD